MSLFQRSISRPSRSRNAWRFFSNAGRSSDERRESPSTMFCVMMGARPGSSEKGGLPSGCTSPIERSTRGEGTSSRGMPREISIRPPAPRTLVRVVAHVPGGAAVGGEAVSMIAVGVFIREPEAQELRRPERDVGLDRALAPRVDGELGPVVADAARPATEGLHLEAGVPAEAILLALLDQIDRVVAIGVHLHVDPAQRVDRLARHEIG